MSGGAYSAGGAFVPGAWPTSGGGDVTLAGNNTLTGDNTLTGTTNMATLVMTGQSASPITITGGDDEQGGSAIILSNPTDQVVAFYSDQQFGIGSDRTLALYGGGLAAGGSVYCYNDGHIVAATLGDKDIQLFAQGTGKVALTAPVVDVQATDLKINGVAGATATLTSITSITITKGLITAVTGT